MNLTKEMLKEKNACSDGYEWYLKNGCETVGETVENLIADDKIEWANWLVTRFLSKENCIRYSIFAARAVLQNFEIIYPDDKRPRLAIEAAENYLNNPSYSADSAASAASAAYSAAYSAADSAASAADSAASAAMKTRIIKYGLELLDVL